jgi:hypothetical protein
MKPTRTAPPNTEETRFRVNCKADPVGAFVSGSDSFAITVAQCIRRGGIEKMWDSVRVYAQEEEDGSLVVQVLVFNPDWDEALQIACIRSRPGDAAGLTALGCNLDHVAAETCFQEGTAGGK